MVRPDGLSSITSGFDRRLLHHEDHGALWSSGSVHHALGHRVALTLGELDCLATLHVQVDLPFEDEKELVLLVVGMDPSADRRDIRDMKFRRWWEEVRGWVIIRLAPGLWSFFTASPP